MGWGVFESTRTLVEIRGKIDPMFMVCRLHPRVAPIANEPKTVCADLSAVAKTIATAFGVLGDAIKR